jgi:membrane-associated protease RseP (regulator of RpoE activity)
MKYKQYLLHIGLFIITLLTTTIAGAEWMFGRFIFWGEQRASFEDLMLALQFSLPFLLILTVHEFAHFFTAKFHQIKTSLPYYIPLWTGFIMMPSFGTMGAFIRIKSLIHSRKEYFDVGVSGPLAGFVIAIGVIWYGFANLPEPEYIFQVHPEYETYGLNYADYVYDDSDNISFKFGNNLIFLWFQEYYVEDASRLPHPNEMIHYPYLLAGYLALFFTALNLLPIGQLDGGHVLFSMFGEKRSFWINRITFTGFVFYAGLGWVNGSMLADLTTGSSLSFLFIIAVYLYFLYIVVSRMFDSPRERFIFAGAMFSIQYLVSDFFQVEGYSGWLFFSFILGRFLGVYHPKVSDNRPLDTMRMITGIIAIIVFLVSFSPRPFIIE